jgi:MIP family channel proteins
MTRRAQAWIAELVGSFVFITIIIGSVVMTAAKLADYGVLGTATAQGLALAAMVTAFAAVSGGHFNPAVTLSAFIGRKMAWLDCVGYIVAQIAGGIAAGAVMRFTFTDAQWRSVNLGTPGLNGVSAPKGMLLEALFTFFLIIAVWATGIDSRGQKIAGIGIGFTLFAILLADFNITGGSVNPARFLGSAVISGHYTDWWVYIAGPAIGAVVAAAYPYLFLETRVPWAPVAAAEEAPSAAVEAEPSPSVRKASTRKAAPRKRSPRA